MFYLIDTGFIRDIASIKFMFLIDADFVQNIASVLPYADFIRGIASV